MSNYIKNNNMIKTKFLINLILLTSTINTFPQAPQSFKYQAMARNANGEIIVNQSVSLLIDIIREATTVYSESHLAITNQFGLINLEIGLGNPVAGVFSDIDWSLGDYYIAISMDPDGGANYLTVGTAQLLSVPYALYADKSGDSYWKNMQSNLNYNQGKVMIGNSNFLSGSGDLNNIPKLSIEGGLWTKMPIGITTTDIDSMYLYNNTIGNALPLVGLYSIYDADYHLRGYWGVSIDRNGGNMGYDHSTYSGLNSDAGSFAVRYRISPTAFRTDFIINGQGNVGIGTTQLGGYFNPKIWVHGGYLQVTDTNTRDAGIVIKHLNKTGYGFARTLHMVNEGVIGDPFTEYRIRNNNDNGTITSWSIGVDNSDSDKFIISNGLMLPTGVSPSEGNKVFSILTNGNIGIGTTSPVTKVSIEDSINSFADSNRRIFLQLKNKSVDIGSEVEINLLAGSNGTITKLLKYSDTYNAYPGQEVANYGMLSDDGPGIIIRAWANTGKIIFKTAHEGSTGHGIERMRIDAEGRVGIGITNPQRTLHISDVIRLEPTLTAPSNPAEGDIYMNASTHKLMVFDGTVWQACW
jgi:hypothetical protein